MKTNVYRILTPLVLLSLFFLLFHEFWDHTINYRDSFTFFAPIKFHVGKALSGLNIYLWNPYQFLGLPCVADIQWSWFYPLNLLFAFVDFGVAHRLYILLHYPLAAVSMFAFLRGRDLDLSAAIVGGLAFALSGYMISQHALVRMVVGMSWAPLALFCMDRALRNRLYWSALGGAVLAIQVLGSDPLDAYITAGIGAILIIMHSFSKRRFARGVSILLIAGASSSLLCAVQISPTLEMLRMTIRSEAIPFSKNSIFSFHPARLVELIWSLPFGTYVPELSYWGKFTLGADLDIVNVPFSMTNYIGLPVTTLALTGMLGSRRRWKWFVLAGALTFLFMSMGHYTPVYRWFYSQVPLLSYFRYPAKYMGWFSGFVAVGAALGIERVKEWHDERPLLLSRAALLYIAVAVMTGMTGINLFPRLIELLSDIERGTVHFQSAVDNCTSGGMQLIAISTAAGAVIFLSTRRVINKRRAVFFICVIMLLDYEFTNIASMPKGPQDLFDFRPVAAAYINPSGESTLGRFRIYKEDIEFRDTNPALQGFNHYQKQSIWHRNILKGNLSAMEGLEDIIGYHSYELREGARIRRTMLSPDVMSLYNVEYVISSFDRKPIKSIPTEVIKRDPLNDISIHRFKNVWPRAYWVPSALRARDEAEAMELLGDTDLKKHAVITSDEPIEAAGPGEASMRPAHMVSYEHDHVAVRTDAEREGWLVLSDRFYPGWQAFVDGERTHIYKANVMVRAVKVPAGRHRVDFHFRPRSVYLGAAISIPAWIGLAAGSAIFWRRGRRSPEESEKKRPLNTVRRKAP